MNQDMMYTNNNHTKPGDEALGTGVGWGVVGNADREKYFSREVLHVKRSGRKCRSREVHVFEQLQRVHVF